MERYKRIILEDVSKSHPFQIGDMIINLVNREILNRQDIIESQVPITLSTLIDKLEKKEDEVFELFLETLESTKHSEELIKIIREKEEKEADRTRIEAAMAGYTFSTGLNRKDPLLFLDVMSQLAVSLKEADIRLICDHFNILRGEREKINKSKNPGLDVVFLLRQRLLASSDDVSELHKVLKDTKSGQILQQYMDILTYPEITLSGSWEDPSTASFQEDRHSMFKVFRRLRSFFERETQTVLFHIDKENIELTLRIPTVESLNAFMKVTNTRLIEEEVSSLFFGCHSNDDTFQLKVKDGTLSSARAILGRNCAFSAVPLCIPNDCIWDSHRKTLRVDKRLPRESIIICKEGFEQLKMIGDEIIIVVCVTGSGKSGKSFFASQLQDGVSFETHHVPNSHTTGIWIGVGATPIQVGEDTARVVVLDTQGLGTHNTDATWEYKISSLCLLLSSYFIFNIKGPPQLQDLYKLGCIVDFSRSMSLEFQEVRTEPSSEKSCQQLSDFLWLFQENLSKPILHTDKECSWTKYVEENLLAPQANQAELNGIRKSITSTFNTIRAADLPPPTFDKFAVTDLLAEKYRDKVNQDYLHRLSTEISQILSSVQVKKLRGRNVTGHQLREMLKDLVSSVNSTTLHVSRVWDVVPEVHLQRHKNDILNEYTKQMDEIDLPEREEVFYRIHERIKRKHTSLFRKATSRFEDNYQLIMKLNKSIEQEIDRYFQILVTKNENDSLRFNRKLISSLEQKFLNDLDKSDGLTCKVLRDSERNCLSKYDEIAKGPAAEQVKNDTKRDRDLRIAQVRKTLLEKAEKQSFKLFETNLQKTLANENNLDNVKSQLKGMSLQSYENVICNDVSCSPCVDSRLRLSQKMNETFEVFLSRRPKRSSFFLFDIKIIISLIAIVVVAVFITLITRDINDTN